MDSVMDVASRSPVAFDFGLFDAKPPPERALVLDYDGTLAAFQSDRMKAVPPPAILEALRSLSTLTTSRTAIVSGRPVQELHELLGNEITIEMWGAHGWERWIPGRSLIVWERHNPGADALADAAASVRSLVKPHHLEIKAGSVAVHTRALDDEARQMLSHQVAQLWEPIAQSRGLQFMRFDGGYELRDSARTKATAIRELRAEIGSNAMFCFLGDDVTDEDGFAELGAEDWPILVAERPRPTHARFWLRPQTDVTQFLQSWTRWTGGLNEPV
jgi:trehalose-phosphatase